MPLGKGGRFALISLSPRWVIWGNRQMHISYCTVQLCAVRIGLNSFLHRSRMVLWYLSVWVSGSTSKTDRSWGKGEETSNFLFIKWWAARSSISSSVKLWAWARHAAARPRGNSSTNVDIEAKSYTWPYSHYLPRHCNVVQRSGCVRQFAAHYSIHAVQVENK